MKKIISAGLVFLTLTVGSQTVLAQDKNSRSTLPDATGIEVLGNCLIYSFFYQRMLNSALGLEVGFSTLPEGTDEDRDIIAFVPLGVKSYLIPKNVSLFLTGGLVFVTKSTDKAFFEDTGLYFYSGVGIEYRAHGGFLFRLTAYSLGFFNFWPGVSIGHAF